jgi:Zn-finger nucleic acid-binding protein
MDPVQVGTSSLEECGRCHGVWVDKQTVEQICASSEQQAAVLGIASVETKEQEMQLEEKIRYVPCPGCGQLMNRVHFANCSKVIVDVCKAHGTWFDKDELRRIVEFIRSGGLTLAREREIAALEAKRKRLLETPSPGGPATPEPLSIPSASADLGDIVAAAGKLLDLFFRG